MQTPVSKNFIRHKILEKDYNSKYLRVPEISTGLMITCVRIHVKVLYAKSMQMKKQL